jgi:hypothetical protein
MKQITECLDRAFNNEKPLKRKWRAVVSQENNYLFLVHYQHLVLVYDLDNENILHEWWELPADKRGLDSAKQYIQDGRHLECKQALA